MKITLKICLLLVIWGIFALPAVAQEEEMSKDEMMFVLRVASLLEKNKATEAYKQVNLAIEKYPKNALLYVLRADAGTDLTTKTRQSVYDLPNEKYQMALADLNKAIELNGDLKMIYEMQAQLHLLYQQHEKSVGSYTKLYELAQKDNEKSLMMSVMFNRAVAYQCLNRFEDAIADLQEVAKIEPSNEDCYNNMATTYLKMKNYPKAHEAIDKGLAINPKSEPLRMNKAFTYIKEGKYKLAIKLFTQLIEDPSLNRANKGYYYNNRGEAKMGLGKFKDALEDINESLKYYPENAYAFRNRGLLHLKMGKKDLACADFKQAEAYGFSKSYGDEVLKLLAEHCK